MRNYLESVYKSSLFVIPAKAGIQNVLKTLDSRFHGNDKKRRLQHLWTDTIYIALYNISLLIPFLAYYHTFIVHTLAPFIVKAVAPTGLEKMIRTPYCVVYIYEKQCCMSIKIFKKCNILI